MNNKDIIWWKILDTLSFPYFLTYQTCSILCKSVKILLIFYWLNFLRVSDSFFSVYLISGIFGICSICINRRSKYDRLQLIFAGSMSVLFSLGVILANWHVFHDLNSKADGVAALFFLLLTYLSLLIAGYSIAFNSILLTAEYLKHFVWTPVHRTAKQIALFAAISMALFCTIDLLTLFLCDYPGALTPDSLWQMNQVAGGAYNNHHPFWHTMLIKGCVSIGLNIFHDINAAVALYSVFQIFLMSLCFTYALTTLYEMGIPTWSAVLSMAFCALMPYNIIFSFTMWKDILFGCMTLFFIVALFRVIYNIGNFRFNIVSLLYGGLDICLLRSNGLFAFVLSVIVFAVLFKKKYIKITALFILIIVISFVMTRPVLKAMNVPQPSVAESLSIPLQQIAKVITDGNELTPQQNELLGKVMDLSAVPTTYANWLADPMKNLVGRSGNQEYLVQNKFEYFKVWLEIGLRYPAEYVEAWIDQTRGFWHGGYTRFPWDLWSIGENSLGINLKINSYSAAELRNSYLNLFGYNEAFRPFWSIGFNFWILMLFFICNVINRRKTEIFMAVPAIAVSLSLMIATPLYYEFRYAYATFTCLPFIVLCSVYAFNNRRRTVLENKTES